MKFWQVIALVSGSIIAIVMALASISYNATLGTDDLAFALVPISNRILFEGLALAFDLGMIASVFGFWHWLKTNRIAAGICVVLFVISSLFSIHSVRGYIALNITKSLAPAEQNKDIYASLKRDLLDAQSHLSDQALELVEAHWIDIEGVELIFPSISSNRKWLSENAFNSAIRRMGYSKEEVTAHGFRATASTILNDRGFDADVIEAALAHQDKTLGADA